MSENRCFHCSLPIGDPSRFFAIIDDIRQPMCCPGCQAVAEAIVAGGLGNYYQHRTGSASQTAALEPPEELTIYDRPDQQQGFVHPADDGRMVASLFIDGITCAACIWLLENHLSALAGVEQVSINLSTHEAEITWQPSQLPLSQLLMAIHRIGYHALPWRADQQEARLKQENRAFIRRLAVAGIGAMQVMMYAIALYSGAISEDMPASQRDLLRIFSAMVATPVVLYSAAPFFRAAWRDIRLCRLGMDVPVAIAIGSAYLASLWATFFAADEVYGEVYYDSATMFTFFLLTGRYLELRARHASIRAARTLTGLLPQSCLKAVAGHFIRVPITDLKPNDIIRILPGDAIPADGLLLKGATSVNEAMLTGEHLPCKKQSGDTLLCGTINMLHSVELQVTETAEQTRLASILRLQRQAQQDKPAIACLADKIAGWFVFFVLLVAVVVYWSWSGIAAEDAFWITLSVLVITCPCALSLATPACLTAATGYLHRLGLLVTRSHLLAGLHSVDHIIFDKTGTLTEGNLVLESVIPVNDTDISSQTIVHLAAALEAHSEHPIARAFAGKTHTKYQASDVHNHPGQGIDGLINGAHYRLGRSDFAAPSQNLQPPVDQGQWLLLSRQHQALAWLQITDTLRSQAASTIEHLHRLDKTVTLLSGDSVSVVAATARALGIRHWLAEQCPDQKLSYINQLQAQGQRVMMVGDGINDAPVLAGADVSVAMGNASDLTRTSADGVLISGNLEHLVDALCLAARTQKIIRQNLLWALGYNLIALPLAAAGMVAPWMAALGMTLSSLLVVTNALRLGRRQICSAGSTRWKV